MNAIFLIYNSTGYKYNRLEFYYLCFKTFSPLCSVVSLVFIPWSTDKSCS